VQTNKPADEKLPASEKDDCSLCGFCPVPLGLCIFIWLLLLLVVILIAVAVILLITRKRKCPKCKTVYEKKDKFCPNCGARLK